MKRIGVLFTVALLLSSVGVITAYGQQSDEEALADFVDRLEANRDGQNETDDEDENVVTTETDTTTVEQSTSTTTTTETEDGNITQNTQVDVNVTVENRPQGHQVNNNSRVGPQPGKPDTTPGSSDNTLKVGGFGGPYYQTTYIDGQFATFSGGYGALVLNSTLWLGGFGCGLSSDVYVTDPSLPNSKWAMGYGGLLAGITLNGDKLLNYSGYLLAGAGAVSVYDANGGGGIWDNGRIILVAEPGLDISATFFTWMRISVGARYRAVISQDRYGEFQPDALLSGFSASVAVTFGVH